MSARFLMPQHVVPDRRSYTRGMNRIVASLCVLTAACGGGSPKQVEQPPPVTDNKQPESEEPNEAPPPAEAAPKSLGAKAALAPVKGAKQPPGTVTFTQNGDV